MLSTTSSAMRLQQQRTVSARQAGVRTPAGLAVSGRPARGALLLRRFKEDDNEETLRRQKKESVIKQQEGGMTNVSENLSKTREELNEALKKSPQAIDSPAKLIDAVQQSGKGYYSPIKVPFWAPAFTRRREAFIGRVAMMGFLGTCILEAMMPGHPGPIHQTMMWTGLGEAQVVSILMAIASYNVLGGLGPWSLTFSPENLQDVVKRPKGPPANWVNPITNFKEFFGISGFGFTKRNEIFNGRLSMLGFALAIFNELRFGTGPLAQAASWFNVLPDDDFYSQTCPKILLGFTAVILALSVVFPSRLEKYVASENDIY